MTDEFPGGDAAWFEALKRSYGNYWPGATDEPELDPEAWANGGVFVPPAAGDDPAAYDGVYRPYEREPGQRITVAKLSYVVPVSIETMLGSGAITEEQAIEMGWTPPPPIPRLRRWRWALRSWWLAHRPHVHLGPCDQEELW